MLERVMSQLRRQATMLLTLVQRIESDGLLDETIKDW